MEFLWLKKGVLVGWDAQGKKEMEICITDQGTVRISKLRLTILLLSQYSGKAHEII